MKKNSKSDFYLFLYDMRQRMQARRNTFLVVIICLALIVVCVTIGLIVRAVKNHDVAKAVHEQVEVIEEVVEEDIIGSEGELAEVVSAPALSELINVSELRTVTSDYRSICVVSTDNGPVYYILYNATVVAGIEMDQVEYEIDDENHVVRITLPDVRILESSVDVGSMEFIFINNHFDTPETGAAAQRNCQAALDQRLEGDTAVLDMARENTTNEVEAMFQPIIDQFYSEYTLEVVYESTPGGAQ